MGGSTSAILSRLGRVVVKLVVCQRSRQGMDRIASLPADAERAAVERVLCGLTEMAKTPSTGCGRSIARGGLAVKAESQHDESSSKYSQSALAALSTAARRSNHAVVRRGEARGGSQMYCIACGPETVIRIKHIIVQPRLADISGTFGKMDSSGSELREPKIYASTCGRHERCYPS